MMLYRFRCWEAHDEVEQPSLVASSTRNGRIGYFDSHCKLTLDITSMAVSPYYVDGEPLIAVALASQPSRITLYAPINELADEIASAQDDVLWHMLRMISRSLNEKFWLA